MCCGHSDYKERSIIAAFDGTSWAQQVRGLQRSGEHEARWEQLASLAGGVLTQLLERAPRTPRNYILEDQTKCALVHLAAMCTGR